LGRPFEVVLSVEVHRQMLSPSGARDTQRCPSADAERQRGVMPVVP
jgi:hypothetical protein